MMSNGQGLCHRGVYTLVEETNIQQAKKQTFQWISGKGKCHK